MITKRFDVPKHPSKDQQYMLLEKPAKESVWYIVIDKNRSVPLVNLKEPQSIKQVLEVVKEQQGEEWIGQYIMGGWSNLK